MAQLALLLSMAMAWLATRHAFGADAPASSPRAAVLHLNDSNFASGELESSSKPGMLRWHAKPFVSAFEFPIDAINAIHWPPPTNPPRPTGDYCFELSGGDVVFGSLVGLNEREAELDVPRIGRIHVDRAHINRIYRWRESADLVYLGPNGLTGWTETSPARAIPGKVRVFRVPNAQPLHNAPELPPSERGWREESGQLVTEKEGATIGGDFGLPARASLEFEISWKNKPDFVFALGVNDADRSASSKRAFRFEVIQSDLVVLRELDHLADLAVVQELAPGPGRAHLHVYLDQEKGRILVFSQAGKQLADLEIASPVPTVLSGLSLKNTRGDLRLEWLRIGRWSGDLPREVMTDQARMHRADGTIEYGNVTRFDPATNEFVVRGETGESRIAGDKMTSMFLSQPIEEPTRAIRAIYQDGARMSGDLEKVEKDSIWLKVPGVKESLGLPIAGLRSLLTLRHEATMTPARDQLPGRLEMDGLRLPGRLVDGSLSAGSSCLVWHPVGSETASPLRPGASGRIVYREPPPPSATTQMTNRNGVRVVQRVGPQFAQAQGVGGLVAGFSTARTEQPAARAQPVREPRSLYLRDGDVIPSIIAKIDEKGVTFNTSISASTFVSHDKVKAVELSPEQSSTPLTVRLTKPKQDRLLTLPRMQKPDPPTQLIRSKNGDYLRGRLLNMDDKKLQVEIHMETKDLPRDRIARIIWLHADEFDESKKSSKSSDPNETRVQVLRNDGVRLTFLAEKFADSTLSGKSEVLGPCRVALKEMDQLLIGGAIDQAAATLIYHQWKLKNAQEPKYVTADEGGDAGGNGTGVESPLVGKPAPDFELALLGGKKFRLADARGEVVVLDFWATWCGPCLQAMPQVERATRDFQEQGVQLVAVNLQETPDQITAMLERHKLKMTVALDRDGTVAEKYKAAAIPQTVIIQRDGKVARLFVGGGPHFEEQLREALKSVLAGDKSKEKN